jgi:hypothetical protein
MGAVPDIDTALAWRGRTVRDQDGNDVGKLSEVHLDADRRPAWGAVKRGLLGRDRTIVPLAGATEVDGDVRLPHELERFDTAPELDPGAQLTHEEESRLREHYGRAWAAPSGEETDSAMTRSEEEVEFRTRPVQRAERVRLKKVLVEDEETRTVPVRREEIRLETEPPPEGQIESVEEIEDDRRT